jgi:N-acetylmuramoyl-L-alanine amidase
VSAASLLFSAHAVQATVAHRQSAAEYARAERLQRWLDARPPADRTRGDYERSLDAYRAVYHGDPGSPDAARSVAAVADLLASEGRCFHDAKLLHDAVAQWKFLRSQYPGSPLRRRAALQIAELDGHDPRAGGGEKNVRPASPDPTDVFAAQSHPETFHATKISRPVTAGLESVRKWTVDASRSADNIATIQSVRYWTVANSTRIAIDMSAAVPYRVYPVPNTRQVAVIFFGAQPAMSLLQHAISIQHDANVSSARTILLTGNQTELILTLERPLKVSSFTLSNPDRLILDIGGASDTKPRLAAVASTPEKGVARSAPQPFVEERPGIAPLAKVAAGPIPGAQRSMTRVLGLRVRRIVIDAGHGGHDSGTVGPGGLEEKDVALDVALRLGRLLRQRLNADVIYTRSTDRFVPLEERTALANRAHADLFLSIHANSSAEPGARGVETYFLNFTASPAALAVAARENAVSDRSVYELSDLVRRITLSDKIDESREFAEDVQQSLYSGLSAGNPGLKDRGVKQAPFVVLIGAHMPSILAEISFLTNPTDASELAQPAYRERLAEALYRGVAGYIDGMSGVRVAKTAPSKMLPDTAE